MKGLRPEVYKGTGGPKTREQKCVTPQGGPNRRYYKLRIRNVFAVVISTLADFHFGANSYSHMACACACLPQYMYFVLPKTTDQAVQPVLAASLHLLIRATLKVCTVQYTSTSTGTANICLVEY